LTVPLVVTLLVIGVAVLVPPAVGATTDLDPPSQPTSPQWTDSSGALEESTSAGDERLEARWNPSTDAASGVLEYRVQLAETPDFAMLLADRRTGSTAAQALFTSSDGVGYGRYYYFRVAARDAAGNESDFSGPSNRVGVREDVLGPAIAHAPVTTAYFGQDIPMRLTSTCSRKGGCAAALYYRSSSAVDDFFDPVQDVGFTRVEMVPGESTTLNGQDAMEWSSTVPGAAVTTTGLDYYLEAEDALAITRFPGTTFVGTPYTAGVESVGPFLHVHTVSPPLLNHVPPTFGHAGQSVRVSLEASCSTGACEATLFYRGATGPITQEPVAASNGELLATPAWPRTTMSTEGEPRSLGEAGQLITFGAEIPASMVDTRGVDYFFRVTDGHTKAWSPGSTYEGYYAPLDGMRTGYWHVYVLEPPHVVHAPVLTAAYRQPITVAAQGTCHSACSATLYYRTTRSSIVGGPQQPVTATAGEEGGAVHFSTTTKVPGELHDFESVPMDVTVTGSADGLDTVAAEGTILASVADTRGVDYFFSLTDGSTTTWWPGTSALGSYVQADGVRVAYHHVRVLEPPHFAHTPPLIATPLRDLVISTEMTCATEDCDALLTYTSDPDAGPQAYRTKSMSRVAVVGSSPAGRVESWQATIPAADVTTRGVAYYLSAFDGYTQTAAPGLFYWGAYVPLDGKRISGAEATLDGESGGHYGLEQNAALMFPVRVLEPPHVVSPPATTTGYGTDVLIEADATCVGETCQATLLWRTTDHRWVTSPMVGTPVVQGDGGLSWRYQATIPGASATVEGLDYPDRGQRRIRDPERPHVARHCPERPHDISVFAPGRHLREHRSGLSGWDRLPWPPRGVARGVGGRLRGRDNPGTG
jgi:hypothetical protein